MPRERLDVRLVALGLAPSRHQAQALIRSGVVLVGEVPHDKPGTRIDTAAAVRLRRVGRRFVSRGGEKLEAALEAFEVAVPGRVCADLGASTGGFTDCLLQRGAAKVYAVDVGYGQLAWKLRQDPRVVVMERTNARHLAGLPEPVSLVVGDLSFISLIKIFPAVLRLGATEAVLLVKPQFEAGRSGVGRGGVVRDPQVRAAAIDGVAEAARDHGMTLRGRIPSPIAGARKGNIEELIWLELPCP